MGSPSSSGSSRSGASSLREEKSFDQMSPPSSLKREIGTWEEEATRSTGTRSLSSTASSRSETSMGGGSYRESSRSRPRSPQDQRRYGVESRSRDGSLQEVRMILLITYFITNILFQETSLTLRG